jgi:ABC-type bacteriocin/lantibiotic exporter with double-glycine peptidase domain
MKVMMQILEYILYPTALVLLMIFVIMFAIHIIGAFLDKLSRRRSVKRAKFILQTVVELRIHNVYTGRTHSAYVQAMEIEQVKQLLLHATVPADYTMNFVSAYPKELVKQYDQKGKQKD